MRIRHLFITIFFTLIAMQVHSQTWDFELKLLNNTFRLNTSYPYQAVVEENGVETIIWQLGVGDSHEDYLNDSPYRWLFSFGLMDYQYCKTCKYDTVAVLVADNSHDSKVIYFTYFENEWEYAEVIFDPIGGFDAGKILFFTDLGATIETQSYNTGLVRNQNLPGPENAFTSRQYPSAIESGKPVTDILAKLPIRQRPNISLDRPSECYEGESGETYWLSYSVQPEEEFTFETWQPSETPVSLSIEFYEGESGDLIDCAADNESSHIALAWNNSSKDQVVDLRIKLTVDSSNDMWQAIGYVGAPPGSSLENPMDLSDSYFNPLPIKDRDSFMSNPHALIIPGSESTSSVSSQDTSNYSTTWIKTNNWYKTTLRYFFDDYDQVKSIDFFNEDMKVITDQFLISNNIESSYLINSGDYNDTITKIVWGEKLSTSLQTTWERGSHPEIAIEMEHGESVYDYSYARDYEVDFTTIYQAVTNQPSIYKGVNPTSYWMEYTVPPKTNFTFEAFQRGFDSALSIEFFKPSDAGSLTPFSYSTGQNIMAHTWVNESNSEEVIRIRLTVDGSNNLWQAVAYNDEPPGNTPDNPIQISLSRAYPAKEGPIYFSDAKSYVEGLTRYSFDSLVVPGSASIDESDDSSNKTLWYKIYLFSDQMLIMDSTNPELIDQVQFIDQEDHDNILYSSQSPIEFPIVWNPENERQERILISVSKSGAIQESFNITDKSVEKVN